MGVTESTPPAKAVPIATASLGEKGAPWSRALGGAGLAIAAVLVVLGVDFYFDVAGRDFMSWLDPRMFFGFARRVRNGQLIMDGLMVPTVFPYFVAPFASSFAGALWVNFLCFVGLAVGIHLLRRPLGITAPSWAVVGMVLTTPLLTGLSRTLFSECLLTATVTLTYAFWLNSAGFTRRWATWGYGVALTLALLSKTTAPVFFAMPMALQALALFDDKKVRELVRFVVATGVTIGVAVGGLLVVAPYTRLYFDRLGNLSIWAMRLIGPGDSSMLVAYTYYPLQLVQGGLLAVGAFLLVPLFVLIKGGKGRLEEREENLAQKLLWLWLVVPLIALSYMPQREPRHIAPCVVPAVLLIFMGLSRLTAAAVRRGLTVAVVGVAAGQYVLMTHHWVRAPYFLDRPLGFEAIAAALLPPNTAVEPGDSLFGMGTPRTYQLQHWEYTTNLALSGFEPSEVLCLGWQLTPGVVYDLDNVPADDGKSSRVAYKRFEDLYSFVHFNAYNKSLGWKRLYYTLDPAVVIANADYILARKETAESARARFPNHEVVKSVDSPGGEILILKARHATTPYRELYIRQFLANLPAEARTDQVELDTICYELLKVRFLAGRPWGPGEILPLFPAGYKPGSSKRAIQWVTTRVMETEPTIQEAYEQFLRLASERSRGAGQK